MNKEDKYKKLIKKNNLYYTIMVASITALLINFIIYFPKFQEYKSIDFVSLTNKFHKNNHYDFNTNNCLKQSINLKKILESKGYEVDLIELYKNDPNKSGHLIDSIKIYIDPTINSIMNKKQMIKRYSKDFNINNIQDINNTPREKYLLKLYEASK